MKLLRKKLIEIKLEIPFGWAMVLEQPASNLGSSIPAII